MKISSICDASKEENTRISSIFNFYRYLKSEYRKQDLMIKNLKEGSNFVS